MKKKALPCILAAALVLLFAFPLTAEEGEEEPLVSTLFFASDIRDALSEVMLQTGVNIIADDTVRGIITLDLEDVPLEQALHMMLLSGGYSFRRIDDYYLVTMADPRSPAFQHMAETETVRLDYISASEARSLLPAFYDPFLRSSDTRDMITITATPEIIDGFREDLAQLDTPPKQVRIQAIVTEISSDLIKEYGANLFDLLTNEPEGDSRFGFRTDTLELTWYSPHTRILANLRALEREQQAEIRADPQVVVADRSSASLFVGEEQVIILEPEGAAARLERVEVGVSLEVTPRIARDGAIELTLAPKISHFTEEVDRRLRIRRSEIATTIYVQDGETLVLAGMRVEEQEIKERKVPILGDIPLLRWLFRQDEEKHIERELLLFLTPEIL